MQYRSSLILLGAGFGFISNACQCNAFTTFIPPEFGSRITIDRSTVTATKLNWQTSQVFASAAKPKANLTHRRRHRSSASLLRSSDLNGSDEKDPTIPQSELNGEEKDGGSIQEKISYFIFNR